MLEQRLFHRVRFRAECVLNHKNITYRGQLENIAFNGALVSFNEGLIVPQGAECTFMIYLEGEDSPLRFNVEIIHSMFTMVGITFAPYDANTKARMYELMKAVTAEPEKLKQELQLLN